MIIHPFPPEFDKDSRVLILGSFPSVASREQMFFYGHKQNRFWKVCARIFECDTPETIEEKKQFLHSKHIALWDSIGSCDIIGSADSTIKNVKPNDLTPILNNSKIEKIFTNGKASHKYYQRLIFPQIHLEDICLPSTSPANAAQSIDMLIASWKQIRF